MSYDRGKCERLMKVCQKGYPASNIHVEYANNTLAECYAVIGAMMLEIDQLQKDAVRYRLIRNKDFNPGRLCSIEKYSKYFFEFMRCEEELDNAIDSYELEDKS